MRRRPSPTRKALLLIPAALFAASACDVGGGRAREALAGSYFDSSGVFVHAGVSTRTPPDIQPLRPEALGSDTAGRTYHLFQMRCGACHQVPDPAMKTGEHWSFLIGRMKDNTRTAGLIPMTNAEADSVLGFLRAHARR